MKLVLLALVALAWGDVISVNPDLTTFSLTQTTGDFRAWTTPNTKRIRNTDTGIPTAVGNSLSVSCAREELESFQLVVAPTAVGSMTVSMAQFPGLPADAWLEVAHATFSPVSLWGQGTYQVTDIANVVPPGGTVTLSSTQPTVLWMTVYVPAETCGKTTYTTSLVIIPQGRAAISIPVELYVYDFVLDTEPHLATNGESQPRFQGAGYSETQLDDVYRVYGQHRMSGRSQSWPAGLNWQVSWSTQTKSLIDVDNATSTQACRWANGCLFRRYVLGLGGWWRGAEYSALKQAPTAQSEAMSTDARRPGTFDGHACDTASTTWSVTDYNGWMCSVAYENSWVNYMQQLVTWLTTNVPNYANSLHGLWYTVNEPQVWRDYTKAAYLCNLAHTRAPGMKVMVSREAHPWIYDRQDGLSCGYDVWVGHQNRMQIYRTWNRQLLGETSFTYWLDTDALCYDYTLTPPFAPGIRCSPWLAPFISETGKNSATDPKATADGIMYRAIPWVLFSLRVDGWLYYKDGGTTLWDASAMNSGGGYGPPRPRISASLMREGLEDYEYLWQANCRTRPAPFTKYAVDATAHSVGSSFAAFRDGPNAADEVQQLRNELGRYLEGSRADMPSLITPKVFPFQNHYIDFRSDPGTNVPFVHSDGNSWLPIDMNNRFDPVKGFGWQSKALGMENWKQAATVWILQCVTMSGGDSVVRSICYNNFNGNDQFFFSLAPGIYDVTVAVGWPGRTRNDDVEYVEVNDVILRNFTCNAQAGACTDVREYSARITVKSHGTGGMLVMSMGSPYAMGYTEVSYMKIVAVSALQENIGQTCARPSPAPCSGQTPPSTSTEMTTTTTRTTSTSTSTTSLTSTSTLTSTTAGSTQGGTTQGGTTQDGMTQGGTTSVSSSTSSSTSMSSFMSSSPLTSSTTPSTSLTTAVTLLDTSTTVQPAISTSTSAQVAPMTTMPPGPVPAVPCLIYTNPLPPGFVVWRIVLRMDISSFNCAEFRDSLAAEMQVSPSLVLITSVRAGSVLLQGAAESAPLAAWQDRVARGESQVANLESVEANGNTVTVPRSGPRGWVIAVAVIGALIVIAAIILVIIFIVRKKRHSSYSSSAAYHSVGEMSIVPSASASSTPPLAVPGHGSSITLRMAHTVVDQGEGILQAQQGDIVFAAASDYADSSSDWMWVKSGSGAQGYIPRSYAKPQ